MSTVKEEESQELSHLEARRLSRNESEKARRDRLNCHIQELARLVPMVSTARRKLDKTSVLRLTVNYLRLHHEITQKVKRGITWRPKFLKHENLGKILLQSLRGFLLVVSQKGICVYASEEINNILGYSQIDVMGQPMYNIVHPQDHELLNRQFVTDADIEQQNEEKILSDGHRTFHIRMSTTSQDKKLVTYIRLNVVGHLRHINIRPTSDTHTDSHTQACLVAMALPVEPQPVRELNLLDEVKNSWVSQHAMDGQFLFIDHRASQITGFLPSEQTGRYVYEFLVPSDIRWVAGAHQLIMVEGEVPLTYCRTYNRCGQQLYMSCNTHIVKDAWTGKPKYIISANTLLSTEEGKRLLYEQKKKVKAFLAKQESENQVKVPELQEIEEHAEEENSNVHAHVSRECLTISLGENKSFEIKLSHKTSQRKGFIVEMDDGKGLGEVTSIKRKAQGDSASSVPSRRIKGERAKPFRYNRLSMLTDGCSRRQKTECPVINGTCEPVNNVIKDIQELASVKSPEETATVACYSDISNQSSDVESDRSCMNCGPVQDTTINSTELSLDDTASTSNLCCIKTPTCMDGQSEVQFETDEKAMEYQLAHQLGSKQAALEHQLSQQESILMNIRNNVNQVTGSQNHIQADILEQKLQHLQARRQEQQEVLQDLCSIYRERLSRMNHGLDVDSALGVCMAAAKYSMGAAEGSPPPYPTNQQSWPNHEQAYPTYPHQFSQDKPPPTNLNNIVHHLLGVASEKGLIGPPEAGFRDRNEYYGVPSYQPWSHETLEESGEDFTSAYDL